MFKSRMLLLFSFVLVFAQSVKADGDNIVALVKDMHEIVIKPFQTELAESACPLIFTSIIRNWATGKNDKIFPEIQLSEVVAPFLYPLIGVFASHIPYIGSPLKKYKMFGNKSLKTFENSGFASIAEIKDIDGKRGSEQQESMFYNLSYVPFHFSLHCFTHACAKYCTDLNFWIGKDSFSLIGQHCLPMISHDPYMIGLMSFVLKNAFNVLSCAKDNFCMDDKGDPISYRDAQGLHKQKKVQYEQIKNQGEEDQKKTYKNDCFLFGPIQAADKLKKPWDNASSGFILARILVGLTTLCFGWTVPLFTTTSYGVLMGATMFTDFMYKETFKKTVDKNIKKLCTPYFQSKKYPEFAITMIRNSINLAQKSMIPVTCFAAACLIMPYMQTASAA